MECSDILISYIAEESGRATLDMPTLGGLKSEAPKHLEVLGRAIRRAPHREAFTPDVKILGRSFELAKVTMKQ
jgi:hypothetical protein